MSNDWVALIATTATGVAAAIIPLSVLFLLFQVLVLNLPTERVKEIVAGTIMATLGLLLFLIGIEMGFLPFGRVLGEALVLMESSWRFVLIGLTLGFVTAWSEPAVRILAHQVDRKSVV